MPPEKHHLSKMEFMRDRSTDNQKLQYSCSKQHYQQPLGQKQSHDPLQKRQAEENPIEYTEEIGIQYSKQNPGPSSELERIMHQDEQYQNPLQKIPLSTTDCPSSHTVLIAGVPLGNLFRTIIPHLAKSNVMQLQLHFSKLRRNEINILDFMRFTRQIAGRQLLQWALDNLQLQIHTQSSSRTTPLRDGINVKTSLKRPSISQKEPLETSDNHSSSLSCKKKKVCGAIPEKSIGEFNDFTAPSGGEEKQSLVGHEEEFKISEAAQKAVQEDERLLLQKIPLQRKLTEIISKYGITCISNNVEQCLSRSVEERMRGLISDLIRLSKMRVDFENPIHERFITSDVQLQILMMNQKAKEVFEEHQAEDVMLHKHNEVNKVTEDNLQTTANVAVQTPVKEDDMLSKWQLMAEQARQKREGRKCATNKVAEDNMQRRTANVAGQTAVEGDDILLKWKLMAEQAWQKCEGRMSTPNKAKDIMLTKDTNIAIRTAVGGDDVLLKWELMAEQIRQKREGSACKDAQPTKDASQAVLATSKKPLRGSQEPENTSSLSAVTAPSPSSEAGKNSISRKKPVRRPSAKDVIAVLEREPQMSKSTLLHCLFLKNHADTVAANLRTFPGNVDLGSQKN